MNNENTVKIGIALKWRDTFDSTKKYYQDNIVTSCGCVFRCKALSAQGIPPIHTAGEFGYLEFINTDTWNVVVDMAYYYNFVIDQKRYTDEILRYVELLKKMLDEQQVEIDDIKKDNLDQWKAIHSLEEVTEDLQSQIDAINEFTANLQRQINALVDEHEKDMQHVQEELDALASQIEELDKDLQKQIDEINRKIDAIGIRIDKHEEKQAEYEATTDLKLLTLSLGTKSIIEVSPEVIHKQSVTSVTIKASIELDGEVEQIRLLRGTEVIATSTNREIELIESVNTKENVEYRVEADYKGLTFPASVNLQARWPIFCGFGRGYDDIKGISNRLSPRITAAGRYDAINNVSEGAKYYIVIPSDIPPLTEFTMGGVDFAMTSENVSFMGQRCTSYISASTFKKGEEISIIVK